MRLLVGLGNPGPKYERNRHNVGFMAVDRIAAAHGFPPWRRKFQGLVTEGRLDGERVILLKPETYMNRSGQSVGEAARFFKLLPGDIIVFHDELDLAPGKVRVKTGGGHAGHNGLRSIQEHIGPDFVRVRIGIGHPGDKSRVTGWVLGDFAKADGEWLEPLLDALARAAPALARGDTQAFMNALGTSPKGGKSSRKGAAGRRPPQEDTPAPRAPQRDLSANSQGEDPAEISPLQRLIERFRR
ncbi:MAG: aminoacyl-tRNA hydrolase [Alphaproteobacteria bacterium]|nr:MAG: aminoacyl-tRNA hydrolase [Alphaproteobacteria bacterium]